MPLPRSWRFFILIKGGDFGECFYPKIGFVSLKSQYLFKQIYGEKIVIKKRILLVLLLSLFVLAIPAAAKTDKTVGEQIHLFIDTPETFPADTPFHIMHGFPCYPSEDGPIGLWRFQLDVDGVPQTVDFRQFTKLHDDPDYGDALLKGWGYNFPEGLPEGAHHFLGRWIGPCYLLLEDCPKRNALVEFPWEATIEFD